MVFGEAWVHESRLRKGDRSSDKILLEVSWWRFYHVQLLEVGQLGNGFEEWVPILDPVSIWTPYANKLLYSLDGSGALPSKT